MGEGAGGGGLVPFLSTSAFPDNISITQIDPRLKQGCFDPNATNANTGGSIVVPQFWEKKERGSEGRGQRQCDTYRTPFSASNTFAATKAMSFGSPHCNANSAILSACDSACTSLFLSQIVGEREGGEEGVGC